MQLTFCGAARQVTGSCFFFETDSSRFLVDCGMFQGGREMYARNLAAFAFDPRRLDFVILTHAHIDHSGLLPRLRAEGFSGPIYTTDATRDLLSVLLPDSAYLQHVEAERAARHGREFVVAYSVEDAHAVLAQVKPVAYERSFAPSAGVRAQLRDAGHILLNRIAGGAIIVAASGMCDGGRIRHHLKHHLPNPHTTVLIIGFQAAGTLGRRLVDRAPVVRIFGEEFPVRAEIATLGGFSAHADQSALIDWLRHFRAPPEQLFLVHGEAEIAAALGARIGDRLGWRSRIPAHGDTVRL